MLTWSVFRSWGHGLPCPASQVTVFASLILGCCLFESQGHVVLNDRLAIVTERLRLSAPNLEARPLVESPGLRCCSADAQVDPRYAGQCPRVAQCRLKKLGPNTPPAMAASHVHAPQVVPCVRL